MLLAPIGLRNTTAMNERERQQLLEHLASGSGAQAAEQPGAPGQEDFAYDLSGGEPAPARDGKAGRYYMKQLQSSSQGLRWRGRGAQAAAQRAAQALNTAAALRYAALPCAVQRLHARSQACAPPPGRRCAHAHRGRGWLDASYKPDEQPAFFRGFESLHLQAMVDMVVKKGWVLLWGAGGGLVLALLAG